MAMEHLKTALLWVLILTSVGLTYSIWTFQPDFSPLDSSGTIESPDIGVEKSHVDLLIPESITIHENEERYWLEPEEERFTSQMEALLDVEFERVVDYPRSGVPVLNQPARAIDYKFHSPIPGSTINELFDFGEETIAITSVDRIYITRSTTSANGEVIARFISTEDEEIYQAETNLNNDQLVAMYEGERDHMYEARGVSFDEENLYGDYAYLPVEPLTMRKLTYSWNSISEQDMRAVMFSDPDLVQEYPRGPTTRMYSDGSRFLEVTRRSSGNVMKFEHQRTGTFDENETETHVLEDALDFINLRGGWTDHYGVDAWHHGFIDSVTYRMHVDGLPVLGGSANQDLYYTKEITRAGNEINKYERPLFRLDGQFNQDEPIALPPLDEMMSYLEEMEDFDTDSIEGIRFGYFMDSSTSSFMIFSPDWFIKRGNWQRFSDIEDEYEERLLEEEEEEEEEDNDEEMEEES
ncbi:YycH family regulatory protein [Alteribacter aurantiacus]|uniref:YycH family regulatory protein n=1 Tax=Alteribacter aurantiacus TaxID=254410 RepID=UPI00041A1AF6|nr:two-component system activity regulator YycH [Alteribacter aurantiacus]